MELRDPFKFYLRGNRNTCLAVGLRLRGLRGKVGVVKEVKCWDHLPTEMLSLIFSYLTPTELARSVFPVCTRWHDVAIPFIKRLKFGPHGTTEELILLVEKLTHLESIDIHNRKDFQPLLEALYNTCEHSEHALKEISLKVGPRASRFSARAEGVLIGNRSRYCCESPSCRPDYCKTEIINDPYSTNLMQFCPTLKRLELQNLSIRTSCGIFYNDIGSKLRSLTHLTIIKCYQFTPRSLKLIAENCTLLSHVTLLQNVKLRFPVNVSRDSEWNEAYKALIKKRGPMLQILEIDAKSILDSTFQALSAATNLHTLTLERATNVHGLGMTAISTLRNLKHLNIHDLSSYRRHVVTFGRLFASGNLLQLETLGLPYCREMNDDWMEVISSHCHNLVKVDFSGCQDIAARGVEMIMTRCSSLRVLNLYPMAKSLGASLLLIPDKTPSLKLLVIGSYCDEEMEKAIEELVARCPNTRVKPDMDGSLVISFT